MSYGALETGLKIIYDDGSWQPILPGYFVKDENSPTLRTDVENSIRYDAPAGYYFDHPDYGIVLAANLQSIRLEAEQFGGRVIIN